jgi:allantoicase
VAFAILKFSDLGFGRVDSFLFSGKGQNFGHGGQRTAVAAKVGQKGGGWLKMIHESFEMYLRRK